MSEDGKYQLAGCGFLVRSNDYGQTWTTVVVESANWQTVAISGDGRCQLAGSDEKLFCSTERGVSNWRAADVPRSDWTCSGLNGDGQF